MVPLRSYRESPMLRSPKRKLREITLFDPRNAFPRLVPRASWISVFTQRNIKTRASGIPELSSTFHASSKRKRPDTLCRRPTGFSK